jgi:hypothetical protein
MILLPQPPEITGVYHHAWLYSRPSLQVYVSKELTAAAEEKPRILRMDGVQYS